MILLTDFVPFESGGHFLRIYHLYMVSASEQGKNMAKKAQNGKKTVDPAGALCYIMTYLSADRFILARFFIAKSRV